MVEAVVAIGIVTLLITGLIVVTTATLKFGRMSKSRTQAIQYAKEGLEIIRIIKDTGWDNVPKNSPSETYCLFEGQQALSADDGTCTMSVGSPYTRTIVFSQDSYCADMASCRKVSATVSWMEDAMRSISLPMYITNWRSIL